MDCGRFAQVHALHDGELSAADAAAVERHAAECAACGALLGELRGLSRMIAVADRAAMPERMVSRLHGQWHAARDRGTVRVLSWLTGAAAALLVAGLAMWTPPRPGTVARGGGTWEIAAVTPPVVADAHAGEGTELVQVAQWIADDLSFGDRGGEGR
jgi:anti-sigma factor RsiW